MPHERISTSQSFPPRRVHVSRFSSLEKEMSPPGPSLDSRTKFPNGEGGKDQGGNARKDSMHRCPIASQIVLRAVRERALRLAGGFNSRMP